MDKDWPPAHGRHGEQCRCRLCLDDRRDYRRLYRARRRGLLGSATPDAPTEAPVVPFEGAVTRGVRAEIAMCPGAAAHPALTETALRLGAGLDDPRQITTHPSLARQLMVALDKVHAAGAPGTGRLAGVATLSDRRPAAKP